MNEMRNDKVECQCCKKMMVPKVVTSAPFYTSGVPVGGRDPESSVCPFCLSPKWMLTEQQVLTGAKANAEFFGIMVLLLINIVVFARLGAEALGVSLGLSVLMFLLRERIAIAVKGWLAELFKG
ncbi:hypothetical protein [Pseudomonas sp. PS01299]|uniref:hypothetical protein n=1 Tax=Pseudomonas sp. PS01299 TaxID=2991435 RepID=UPI00249BDC9E|nr:hypothetical protein [Pseudomonas sp. PS01299]